MRCGVGELQPEWRRGGGGRESVCSSDVGERNGEREREAKVGQNHAAATEAEDEDAVLPGGG